VTWNKFFFAPQSTIPIALFRILYGALVIATLLLLHPDWLAWYGVHAWETLPTVQQLEPGWRLNLFAILPQDDRWIEALFWVFLASAVLLTLGLLTRLNAVVVFLCLVSVQQRNLYILHGGDTFLRVAGFFLIFAPAGAALSLDRRLRPQAASQPPWAQRMIQFELSMLYIAAFCSKIQGAPWLDGTALYYVYHLDEIQRFPLPPWLLTPTLLKLGTWAALATEFTLGIFIWFRRVRYYVLALGVLFHVAIEYSLNIPLFEWDVLSGYILFIDGADYVRAWNWIRRAIRGNRNKKPECKPAPVPTLQSPSRTSSRG
jgi:hypothetical protein